MAAGSISSILSGGAIVLGPIVNLECLIAILFGREAAGGLK